MEKIISKKLSKANDYTINPVIQNLTLVYLVEQNFRKKLISILNFFVCLNEQFTFILSKYLCVLGFINPMKPISARDSTSIEFD